MGQGEISLVPFSAFLFEDPLHNVRTGKPCRITTSHTKSKNVVPVRSYRDVLNSYVNNPETKFNGPDGLRCGFATRGMLQRKHVIARNHTPCGKEFKRKLEQGPVDHEIDAKCRVYENGRVAADSEMLRKLSNFSEREISKGTGIKDRNAIRAFRHGGAVTRKMYKRYDEFLRKQEELAPSPPPPLNPSQPRPRTRLHPRSIEVSVKSEKTCPLTRTAVGRTIGAFCGEKERDPRSNGVYNAQFR